MENSFLRNNHSLKENKCLFFSAVLMIVYTLMPVTRALPLFVRLGVMGLIVGLLLLGIITAPSRIRNDMLQMLLFIMVFVVFYYFTKWSGEAIWDIVRRMFTLFLFWSPMLYAIYYKETASELDRKHVKTLVHLIFICVSITAVTTIIGLNAFPDASRILATGNEEAGAYSIYNIGGYGFAYALLFFMIYSIYKYYETKKIGFIIILLLSVFCVFSAQFMLAILLLIPVLLTLSLRKAKIRNVILVLLLFLVFYFLFEDAIIHSLPSLSGAFRKAGLEYPANKTLLIYQMEMTGETDGGLGDRILRYQNSFHAFMESPIFGQLFGIETAHKVGGHSELLDLFARTGLFGLVFLVPMLKLYFKRVKKVMGCSAVASYFQWSFLIMLVLMCINTVFIAPEIGIMIFLLPVLIALSGNEAESACS